MPAAAGKYDYETMGAKNPSLNLSSRWRGTGSERGETFGIRMHLFKKVLKAYPISGPFLRMREDGFGRGFCTTGLNNYDSSRVGIVIQPEGLTQNPPNSVDYSLLPGLKVLQVQQPFGGKGFL